MEDIGILDVDNSVHLFCLQYVYLDRINANLQRFLQAWNNHPLSSERNLSPNQLWTIGLLRNTTVEEDFVQVTCTVISDPTFVHNV